MKRIHITCLGILLFLLLYLVAGPIIAGSGDDPTSVVSCLGDSITEGIPYSGTENTYPARLQVMLDTAYGSGSFEVINHGVGGWRADQVRDHTQGWMEQDNPDYVLLLVGGNDLAQLQSIESTVTEVQAIVDLVTAHTNPDSSHPQIIVSAIPPNLISELATWWVSVYNDSLESDLTGMHLWFTSNWDDFYDPGTGQADASLMADPVHPNVEGYVMMAENWFEVLDPLLPTSTSTPTPTATPTSTPTPTPTPACDLPGDLNCDCVVDIADIMLLASRWHSSVGDDGYDPAYDLNGDGSLDIVDIMLVAVHWGETC
jgi:lysophospholipase L1-like esterase